MKKHIPVLIGVALLSAAFGLAAETVEAQAATNAPTAKAHVLTNDELDKLLSDPQRVLLIDVRRPDEVSAVGGFPVYLSIQIRELEADLKWIPKDRTIVTVSNHAGRAQKAAELLAAKGFKVAGAAGAETYEKAGGKWVTRIPVPAPAPASAPVSNTGH
jgi:rhodanese-related sulfurtransferase